VNYYEHHLRDYDAATAHLSWDEDLAYTRLLRWYYRKERPIPADVKEACRQVRAATKVQRDAVHAVLQEFFELREDGWHKDTCDEVIARYRAGEPEREAKKLNEDTRLSRHRAERRELFRVINGAGIHRQWNTPMAELRELAKKLQAGGPETVEAGNGSTSNAPATPPATGTATPATATHTPSTNPQAPDTRHHDVAEEARTARPEDEHPPPDSPARATMAGAVCAALKAKGIGQCNPGHPTLLLLIEQGAEVQNFLAAVDGAKDKTNPFAYLLAAVDGQLADARKLAARGLAATPATPATRNGYASARAARMAEAVPSLAANGHGPTDFLDTETRDVTPRRLG
jgi:uncharacterized protein YdaU (DUF1376 family)